MAEPGPQSPRTGAWVAELLLVAGGSGLLTGALYALVTGVRQKLMGQLVWHSRDLIWMAPLAHVALFLALSPLAFVAGLIAGRDRGTGFGVACFGFLGVCSLLLPFEELARWATVLLALGVGLQARRLYLRAAAVQRRRLAYADAGLAALVAVAGAAQRLELWRERRAALAALPAAEATAPNVLLIILDTVRGASLSLYGYPRATTPALARWAAGGVVFERAMATAPWTLPSHGTLFTGRLGNALGGDWLAPVRLGEANLARTFHARGYLTAGFVANLLYTSYESGLSDGFVHYDDYPLSFRQVMLHCPLVQTGLVRSLLASRSPGQVWAALRRFNLTPSHPPGDEYKPAGAITDAFLAWLGRQPDRPFFAFLNYFDAHGPYRAPAAFQDRFAAGRGALDRYDAAIAYLDAELDRLFAELARRGVLDRTVVVVTSDHGEQFGEHGLKGHANSLYLPLLQVPLVLRYPPRVPAGLRVEAPVTLQDLPATVLDLAGAGTVPGIPGSSLVRHWTASSVPLGPIVAELGRGRNVDSTFPNARTWLQSALDDRYHYIRDGEGREQLFAYRTDPEEGADLAHDPAQGDILRRFRALLDSVAGIPEAP